MELEIPLAKVREAIQILNSKTFVFPEQYKTAHEVLLCSHEIPGAERLAFELINSTAYKQGSGLGLNQEMDQCLAEQYIFYGLKILYELVRHGRWKNTSEPFFIELKGFLLRLALDGVVSSYLTQNKLASLIAELALIHWPENWPELFCVLQSNVTYIPTYITLSVFRDLVSMCWDFSSCATDLSFSRQRDISKHLETGVSKIFTSLKNASFFLVEKNPNVSVEDNSGFPVGSNESLLDLLLDTLSCFAQSPKLISGLIRLRADDIIFFILVRFPHKQQDTLNVLLTVIESLGKRQRRGVLLMETLNVGDINRLTSSVNELSRVMISTMTDRQCFLAKITIALIIKSYVEKCYAYLISSKVETLILENLWRYGILLGIAHPSFTLSCHAIFSASVFLSHYRKELPSWISCSVLLSMLFFKVLRQGEPSLEKFMKLLEPHWNQANPQDSCWPMVILQKEIFQRFGIPQEWIISWFAICDSVKFLECQIDGEQECLLENNFSQIHLDEHESSPSVDTELFSAIYHKRFSVLKTAIAHALTNLWSLDGDPRQYILTCLNQLWEGFTSCQLFRTSIDYDPVRVLKTTTVDSANIKTLEALSNRLKSYLSPSFVFLDGFFFIIESIAQKAKLDPTTANLKDSDFCQKSASTLFANILTYQFYDSPMLYALEMRRLDFIGAVSHMMTMYNVPSTQILEFIFEKAFYKEMCNKSSYGNVPPLCTNKTSSESEDRAYLIRRRALFALIHFSERSSDGLKSFLENVLDRIKSRLSCKTIDERERFLLLQVLVAVARSSKNYHAQKWFQDELFKQFDEMLKDPGFQNLSRNMPVLISFFYGDAVLWESGSLPTLDELRMHRKKIIRFIGYLEGILQRSSVPQEIHELNVGQYLIPGILANLPLQRLDSGSVLPCTELETRLAQYDDLSKEFQFGLLHPLNEFVSSWLDTILSLLNTFNTLWKDISLYNRWPHLKNLLAMGEEEWKAIEGNIQTHSEGDTLRVVVEKVFPIPYSGKACADAVRLTRRQNFHLRILLYRCLGRMGEIHSSFFTYPNIHWKIKVLLLDDVERLPLPQLITPIEDFCSIFFNETNLVSLQTFTTVPVFDILKYFLLPLLQASTTRLTSELQQLIVLRDKIVKENENSSAYLLRGYALKRIAALLLEIVTKLVSFKGVTLTERKHSNTLMALPSVTPNWSTQVNHVQPSDEGFPTLSHRTTLLKYAIFHDPQLMNGLTQFCINLLSFPNAVVMKDTYSTIRLIVKQATKHLSSIPSHTSQLVAFVFERCISALLGAPLLNDMTCLTNSDTSTQFSSSPLHDFVHRSTAQHGLSCIASNTLYECLVGFLRCHRSHHEKIPLTEPEHITVCPNLYNALLQLTKLPVPLSEGDLKVFISELLKPAEAQDLKSGKSTLVMLFGKNLKALQPS